MNERLKELARQAKPSPNLIWEKAELERFAELVRQDEREAIAALVEADGRVHPKAPDAVWAKTVAKLIRARGNHEQD
jgi:hypothetical protein